MNRKDLILQNHLPTVMAPKFEEIIPCEIGKTRLVMGHDGLYIETNQIWGRLVRKLWHSDRLLPYGVVKEVDTFRDIVNSIWPIMHEEVIPHAAEYAAKKIEWAGQIIYTPQGLRYLPLDFSSNEVKRITSFQDFRKMSISWLIYTVTMKCLRHLPKLMIRMTPEV